MIFFKKCGILVLSLALAGCGCGSSKKEDKPSQAVSSVAKSEQTSQLESKEENPQESSATEKESLELNKLQVLFAQMTPEFTREQLEAWIAENPDIHVNLYDSTGSEANYYLAFDWEDTLARYRDTRGVRLRVDFERRTNKFQSATYDGDNVTGAYFYNSDSLWGYKNNPAGFYIHKDYKEWIQVTALEALEYQASDGRMQIN